MYYGDEIGMHDVPIPLERVQDPFEKNVPGMGLGRDPERTPMQWDSSPHAGFSQADPWLPVAADHPSVNVAAQREDPASLLSLYRRLIRLRASESALSVGSFEHVAADDSLFAYIRAEGNRRFLIVLNFTSRPRIFRSDLLTPATQVVLSTHRDMSRAALNGTLTLDDDEGVVIAIATREAAMD